MKIGFIGLGAMGRAMATNLVNADFDVIVWNRSADKCKALVEAGAKQADTPADCAAADVLITMLADDAALAAVVDEHGLIEALGEHTVHVNMATVSINTARDMARRHADAGKAYVAAPVLGRPDMAKAAKLQVLAAGPNAAIETARPALETMGAKVWPAGEEAERANVIKLATNYMLVAAVETMGEAASMTAKYGVEPGDFLEIITQSVFASPAYQGYAPAMKARDYDNPEGFKLALGAKDMDLALAAAAAENVPMPMGAAARQRLSEAMAAGTGDQDLSALAEVSRRGAHLDD
ncbi:NAD(P)-dependent oxidoreductase [Salinisphaera hydrothermalis]|uniref:NAD-binding 6-phosphogluconate dehydrogenase n=1 Tax=Salinisphaera hydrothermalis (strain C41B8) TaxID=1304275 RepID=A0A084IPM6_SALHC|nr:NAD(P)-dependent oxidoreductase [Salinisphaera hydrothermalis]KEZ78660.1 NAD-binding 6-phosphogluconate dehydrogenase [Salinisphaera hydrothermalis C41B8]